MNTIKKFTNPLFGEVRIMTMENGQIWFVGKDVAEALGYKDAINALKSHVDDEDKLGWRITTSGQGRNMTVITESGLYSLILSSKLPQAKQFKHWVTAEVLPQIRKTGGYIPVAPEDDEKTILCKAIGIFKRTVDEQQKQLEAQKPLVQFADAITSSDDSILIRDLAKLITQNGVKIGPLQLFCWLRNNDYLFQRSCRPIQKWVNEGLFSMTEGVFNTGHRRRLYFTTKVTPKGQHYFLKGFLDGKFNPNINE